MLKRLAFILALIAPSAHAEAVDPGNWPNVLARAQGQTVYFNAWGGDPRINAYIDWAGRQAQARFGVEVVHVKLTDTAEAVGRVLAEKTAGTETGGAVDLIWINGENFAAMKRGGLLFGPWAEQLPNFALTDPDNNPAVRQDFTIPVEGLEAPWGAAQMVFYHDSAAVPAPPTDMAALADWAAANPGRFTYPQPPDFLGSTFLKQVLIEVTEGDAALYRPAATADFARVTAPVWAYLDALQPTLWRGGRAFPANTAELRRLMGDGEILIGLSFDPAEASANIASGEWPETVRTHVHTAGTIGNVNFVAIPFNASHKAGAMAFANFLLSPEAQARKADPDVWGGLTVLSMPALSPEQRALFEAIDPGPASLSADALGPVLPEPHPSWMEQLEDAWQVRYGAG